MKFKFLLFLYFIAFQSFAQVSLSADHIGRVEEFDDNTLKKFKETTTIFVLSDIYSKEKYKEILDQSWDVTPYKLVSFTDFNRSDYLGNEFSIAEISGFTKKTDYGKYLHTFVDFVMYNNDEINAELKGLSDKKIERKYRSILSSNKLDIARFYLYPKEDFIDTSAYSDLEINDIVDSMYTTDAFFNYKPGYLKNYFQKVNNLIAEEDLYSMYAFGSLPELENLATETLYVPEYIGIKFRGGHSDNNKVDTEYLQKLFKKYDYTYEFLPLEELDKRIMSGEHFYYLRYARVNAQRFIQVVNSATGEIVFKIYITGLSYKLKRKHLKEISNEIKQVIKKNRRKR